MRARTPRSSCRAKIVAIAAVVVAIGVGCGAGIPQGLPTVPISDNEIETYSRRHLLDARALRDEGRLEAAARVAARGLELRPDHAELQRLRAELLENLGRGSEARAHRRVADLLDPPPPPPPNAPVAQSSAGIVVDLLPPPDAPDLRDRVPRDWPDGPVATTLRERLRIRLPEATIRIERGDGPRSVAEVRAGLVDVGARAAISIRVNRAFCGETLKDGQFAVAWMRAAAATSRPGAIPVSREVRRVVERPVAMERCREEAVARSLEDVLALPEIVAVLEAPETAGDERWNTTSVRTLRPSLGRRIVNEIDAGRELLRSGQLSAALTHFEAAANVDPEDVDARAFLDDAQLSLAMSEELAHVGAARAAARRGRHARGPSPVDADPGTLSPAFTPEQKRLLEARLVEEQRRRDELLATLAAMDEDRSAPDAATLASLRPAEIRDPEAVGPRLARTRVAGGEPVTARVLYGPGGAVIARYYFGADPETPVLREEDGDGDALPDRWVAYSDGARQRVWEDRRGTGSPDLLLVFARGGDPLERLEIDSDGDQRPERVFRYSEGRLHAEDRDTNGDGRADLFEQFDPDGELAMREEDVNGDGNVDVRTAYRSGRIVRREIVNPDAVTEFR